MATVNLTINGKAVSAAEGTTILEAARANGILIPNLCNLEGVHRVGSCRICVVEVAGARSLQASCITPVREGMEVRTNSERVRKSRRVIYELMLSDHPRECLSCSRNRNCELQALGETIQVSEPRFGGKDDGPEPDESSPSIVRDTSKCVLCRRCVTVCGQIQGVGAINVQERGFDSMVGPSMGLPIDTTNCTYCGQCTTVCPVGALTERDSTQAVWKALLDPDKHVVVQTAPAIRAALGEEFGLDPGTLVTGKMATALREVGFDAVFDTNFAADLTIIEEGHELLERLTKVLRDGSGAALPMITSCSPGWIKYIEHEYPTLIGHLSTCKSPHMMMGALLKTYYADKKGIDPASVYVVSIMPCTAKKFEVTRPEMFLDGRPTVDAVLTTRELGRMLRDAGIPFKDLGDSGFDSPLGDSSGAGDIFGTTGGVMEAALRTVYEVVTGREIPYKGLDITDVRGFATVKEATVSFRNVRPEYFFLEGATVRVAVTSGLAGAKRLMRQLEDGESPYHFIEVMGCPGGCISGGGQPRMTTQAVREARMRAIYEEDKGKAIRKSHMNPDIIRLYSEFLKEPLGHKSHELLHTHYVPRGRYNGLKDG